MTHRYRILAVDDNDEILEIIRMTLSDDFDVLTLNNPMKTYEMIELFEPDLLILDVMMPRITGFQLTELLKKNPRTQGIPIVILSAKDTTGEIKHGYKLGASLYLTKPFSPQRLLKNIQMQIEQNPPPVRPKALPLEQVQIQIDIGKFLQPGQAALSSSQLASRRMVNPFAAKPAKGAASASQEKKGSEPASSGPEWHG